MILIAEHKPRKVVFIALAIPFASISAFCVGSAAATAAKDEIRPCMVPSNPKRVETFAINCR